MGRQNNRQRQKRVQRRQEARRQQPVPESRGRRFNPLAAGLGVLIVLAAIGLFLYGVLHQGSSPAHTAGPTPTTVPVIGGNVPVDGVQCNQMENLAYHIHQHLALYDHGKRVPVPSEIGIPGTEYQPQCFYWIHVHLSTPNIIHVESPTKKIFQLGTFFGIWKQTKQWTQPKGDAFVKKLEQAAAHGQVTVFLNGKRWTHGYKTVPLKEHAVITVEIGTPVVPPKPYTNWAGL